MRRPDWYDYDSVLQMVRAPKDSAEPDMDKLRFLRWSMIHRNHTHQDGWICGNSSGDFAPPPPEQTNAPG